MLRSNDGLNSHFVRPTADYYTTHNDFDDSMSFFSTTFLQPSLPNNRGHIDKGPRPDYFNLDQQPNSFHDDNLERQVHQSIAKIDEDNQTDNVDKLHSLYSQIQKCFDDSFSEFSSKLVKHNRRMDPKDLVSFDSLKLSTELRTSFNTILGLKLSEKISKATAAAGKLLTINRYVIDLRKNLDELASLKEGRDFAIAEQAPEDCCSTNMPKKLNREVKELKKERERLISIATELENRRAALFHLRCKEFFVAFNKQLNSNEK